MRKSGLLYWVGLAGVYLASPYPVCVYLVTVTPALICVPNPCVIGR